MPGAAEQESRVSHMRLGLIAGNGTFRCWFLTPPGISITTRRSWPFVRGVTGPRDGCRA